MAKNKLISLALLYPISKIYGWGTAVRNMMFDRGFLKSEKFDIPVIAVGNITVGGAGKTPHTEHIVDSLCDEFKIGVLSRGYKRRTKGFVQATENSRPEDIGDEPYQIFRRFNGKVMVAVCEKRVDGIRRMREIDPSLDMIVLDDAFQHRYVNPTVAIVLSEYSRLPYNDHLLPYGRLRESAKAINRADIVVVTKCPDGIKPMELRIIKENLQLYPYQKLLFSRYRYKSPVAVFPSSVDSVPSVASFNSGDFVLALTGVANPRPFVRYIRKNGAKVKIKRFADHHNFSHSDMVAIKNKFDAMEGDRKYIFTTEKDAVRLASNPYFPHELKPHIFYVPIEVALLPQCEMSLADAIKHTIRNKSSIQC